MKAYLLFAAVLPVVALSACQSAAERQADATKDRLEQQSGASAAQAGSTPAALGLTETQLLEADLVAVDGTDLGDVAQVRRNAGGRVEGLLVSIEDVEPDRYVLVPIAGLTARVDGDDTDLQTTSTASDLAAMKDETQFVR